MYSPACTHLFSGWLVGCLMFQQHASVSQGRICTDNFTFCHTEIEVADPTFYLTQSHSILITDTGLTSPSADPIMPGAWHCFLIHACLLACLYTGVLTSLCACLYMLDCSHAHTLLASSDLFISLHNLFFF